MWLVANSTKGETTGDNQQCIVLFTKMISLFTDTYTVSHTHWLFCGMNCCKITNGCMVAHKSMIRLNWLRVCHTDFCLKLGHNVAQISEESITVCCMMISQIINSHLLNHQQGMFFFPILHVNL